MPRASNTGRVKTLHTYITRQVLAALMMTVAVFTFVLLLGNIMREIFALLFNDQASLGMVVQAIAFLIPYVLVFALPMGLLTATLLVFGRLSADQELTAIRSGGISLVALITPVLLLSGALALVCASVNLYLAPQCRMAYKDLIFRLSNQRPNTLLTEGRFVKDIPGFIIYVGQIQGEELHDVMISKLDGDGSVDTNLRAPRGHLHRDPSTSQIQLTLEEARGATLENGIWRALPYAASVTYEIEMPNISRRQLKLNEMTFWQLRDEMRRLEAQLRSTPALPDLPPTELRQTAPRYQKPLFDMTTPIKVQIHQQVAFSFACIGFTLVGIPLGIRAHRKETSIGIAIALVLVLIYYSFYIVAASFETRSEYVPHLIVWIPNFIFQAVGIVLLWRANRT